jgi:ElaB/YqjD/DUF883 family membrane-anchored ribosome-binding protein
MIMKDLKELSLDGLFERLHQLMANLVSDIESVIQDNKEVSMDEVRDLRSHINYKLGRKEEVYDNQKLLKLLNLFSEDRAVLEIIKEDSEEWLELLEAIESNIRGTGGKKLTRAEMKEVEQIGVLTKQIKGLLRNRP